VNVDTLVALGGVLLGAVLAGGFTLLNGSLLSGREHDRWVRASRLEAYADYLVAVDDWTTAATIGRLDARFRPTDTAGYERSVRELDRELGRAQSRVALIGPNAVRAAAEAHRLALLDQVERFEQARSERDLEELAEYDDEEVRSNRAVMLGVMNFAVGVGPRKRFGRRFRAVE
jgi:hypothetical protein